MDCKILVAVVHRWSVRPSVRPSTPVTSQILLKLGGNIPWVNILDLFSFFKNSNF